MSNSDLYNAPSVQDKAARPPGILPKNTTALVIGGIALLMVIAIALSGRNVPKERQPTAELQSSVVDPNEARINEYRERMDELSRKLATEQNQLAQTNRSLGLASPSAASVPGTSHWDAASPKTPYSTNSRGQDQDWLTDEKEKRNYLSLFASNVALSYRKDPANAGQSPSAPVSSGLDIARFPWNADASHSEQENLPRQTSLESADEARESIDPRTSREESDERKNPFADLDRAQGKNYRLLEGTVLETVLTNRLDGSFSVAVNCMITTNVYSHDRQHLLIPQGSRVLGEVRKVEAVGQSRLAVVFHRLIMPDGYSVSLDKVQGLNQVGETGLMDEINHHYFQLFGVLLAIGGIAGLSEANTAYGTDASAADAYRQGVASSLSQSALHILDRYLNVLPTITIREGHRVKIYLTDDLVMPAYDQHQMPSDL